MHPILRQVLSQVEAAKPYLRTYAPEEIDWPARCESVAANVVPWLVETAPSVRSEIDACLASPSLVREKWNEIKSRCSVDAELAGQMDDHLGREKILLGKPSGTVISKLVESNLIALAPGADVASNGASDYPDLYLTSLDYSGLPAFAKTSTKFGAARKGGRPVRVPDGIEIKTVKSGSGIDCHYPHAGLHYVLIYDPDQEPMRVVDIRIGFARRETYRISERRTEATTVKASLSRATINGEAFVSILSDS